MALPFESDSIFCQLIKLVINSEGKFVNHPSDPGGPTMYGVAYNYNVLALKKIGLPNPMDVQRITIDQAKQIYYDKYWLASNGNGIQDIDLAYIHLDAAINCGTGAASMFLSRLSRNPKNFEGHGKNKVLFMTLFLEYLAHRLHYYTHCKNRKPFIDGWVNRMVDVIRNSLVIE